MIIRPVGQKIVRYELSFIGDDGMTIDAGLDGAVVPAMPL